MGSKIKKYTIKNENDGGKEFMEEYDKVGEQEVNPLKKGSHLKRMPLQQASQVEFFL